MLIAIGVDGSRADGNEHYIHVRYRRKIHAAAHPRHFRDTLIARSKYSLI
ncbi:MAG: hypothetical protein Q4A03_10060 [Rothia sp. (in: high G+C Gram-positive bacteria)]|nr:hypothetical protein [Rothia sp. (in: high G+C Gram-positive bacteria)]